MDDRLMTASTEDTSPPAAPAAAADVARSEGQAANAPQAASAARAAARPRGAGERSEPGASETNPRPGTIELGYAFAAIGAILFSTKSVAVRLVYAEPVDAATLLALRMALALPIYIAIGGLAVIERRRSGKPLPPPKAVLQAALIGALGYWFASYTDFLGLEFISAQFERLILFTYPLFVVIFGALFFRQPLRLRALAAIGVSYAGLALIFVEKVESGGSAAIVGAGLVLCSALAFAFYQLLAKTVIAVMGPRLFTCVAMSGAAVGAFVTFLAGHPPADLMVSQRVFGLSVFLAIGATVLPSFFLNAALHRISAQANAAIGAVSPVVTIVLAAIFLGEALKPAGLVGAALVLAGVGWFTLADRAGRSR
jgi:drug/metabolite transporter (DMT)-like permease